MRRSTSLIPLSIIAVALLAGCSKAPEHTEHDTAEHDTVAHSTTQPSDHATSHSQPHSEHQSAISLPDSLETVSFTNASGIVVTITQPIIRAAFSQARTGAAYVSLSNQGEQAVTLESVSAPVSLVDEVQLHDMVMDGETMKMEQIMDGIMLPVGSDIALQPGGQHIMLMGLNDTLDAGKTFPLTLNFGDSGSIMVNFTVVKL
jgi:copper(I)-binding protein